MSLLPQRASFRRLGFSLVEMMACVSIIGIIAFMAIPSITRMRGESERNLVIARAEALNLAQASFIQVRGRAQAQLEWAAQSTPEAKYQLIKPYLSFADPTLLIFSCGYTIGFPRNITLMEKVTLTSPTGATILY